MNPKIPLANGKSDRETIADIIRWDIENWSKALPFWEKHGNLQPGMKALGVGEREGGLSLWLALKGLDVTCTEYTEFPESTAVLHAKYGVDSQMAYSREDVLKLTFDDAVFDVVIFKSMMGALRTKEKQQQGIDELYRVLKPGGRLLIAENLEATHFHRFIRSKFAGWGDEWKYLSLKEGDLDLFDKFQKKTTVTEGFWGFMAKGRLKGIMHFADRTITRIFPKSWNYILFGVFTK